MSQKRKKERVDPAYLREQGKREAEKTRGKKVVFSMTHHVVAEGQSVEQWQELGLLDDLFIRMKFVGQHSVQEALHKQYIKQYTKVDFPPNSEFKVPLHIQGVTWAVMHLTDKSKEVVAGYVDDHVFHIVFLDKDHKFWPTQK
ncbi:hypothetical protein WSM22_40470 [Cytophagales bacterium WSM2-2]|nr:hypothetical protein WSM22_40470 [Cytophagales bacterium WSM2-2]